MHPIQYEKIPSDSKFMSHGPSLNSVSFAYIDGLTSSQVMYVTQASRSVKLSHPKSDSISCAALMSINRIHNENVIYIEFNKDNSHAFGTLHRSETLKVQFLVNHNYFYNLTRSVDEISYDTLRQLIPHPDDFSRTKEREIVSAIPEYLDYWQSEAVRKIVSYECAVPILISGPFGSGKTYLLTVATSLVLDESWNSHKPARILLSCHNQATANTLINTLIKLKHHLSHNFVRVVSEAAYHEEKQSINITKFLNNISAYLKKDYLVIVTTYSTALRLYTNHSVRQPCSIPQGFFTHIFIDEGAQSREPECIAPLCMANKDTRIVIAGDQMQVHNYVKL